MGEDLGVRAELFIEDIMWKLRIAVMLVYHAWKRHLV